MNYLRIGLLTSLVTLSCVASSLDNKIIYEEATGNFATVAGHVSGPAASKARVTIENAGLKYSTIPDADGDWAIVFRYLSMSYTVKITGPSGEKVEGRHSVATSR